MDARIMEDIEFEIEDWFNNTDHIMHLIDRVDPRADRTALHNMAAGELGIKAGDPAWSIIGEFVDDFFTAISGTSRPPTPEIDLDLTTVAKFMVRTARQGEIRRFVAGASAPATWSAARSLARAATRLFGRDPETLFLIGEYINQFHGYTVGTW